MTAVLFRKPTVFRVKPERSCGSVLAFVHGGSGSTRRRIMVPGAPGLVAVAVSIHVVRID